ncbi:MAG: NADH:flavin oxidoreductase [Myxococcales bacterium]|jgi:2,4-dienoyl-CoA reductase-like NADH-dependent reductase (Old Yellow Enzyme family)|nr:NADH:flavin oxidoreductase [Myxococcales bacterium]
MKTAFTPYTLGNIELRNRFIRAGCFEGMAQEGQVTDALIEHHEALARGGMAMTTVGYLSASEDGRGFGHELWANPAIQPRLRQLTDAVHRHGALASVQIVHCGFFASPWVTGYPTYGASKKLCLFRLSICRKMTLSDIREKVDDFVRAAQLARDSGFDAIEVHAGHGYLLSQFLSPWTNRRDDEFGGSLDNRLRFPVMVISALREALGPDFPVLVKMNLEDGFRGGVTLPEAVIIARAFADAGATALIPSCGFTARTPFMMLRGRVPAKEMIRNQPEWFMRLGLIFFRRLVVRTYPFSPLFLLNGAREIRNAVSIPVIYIGGVLSASHIATLMAEGFPLCQLGRATIENPNIVQQLGQNAVQSSDCDQCNRCVATMDAHGVYCVTAEERRQSNAR